MECQELSLRRSSRSNRPLMQVEQLEARWCPDAKAPPVLQYSVAMADPIVTVTGRVTGGLGASTVVFAGSITRVVLTDSNGDFSFTATPNFLGKCYAVATDSELARSVAVKAFVTSLPPGFATFTITEGNNNLWTFAGTVNNEELDSLWVTFEGLACLNGVTANVDCDGDFSIGVIIPEGTTATIVAHVTDCWGLNGTAATTLIA